MNEAKKKPLLVGFIEIERDFIKMAAASKGMSQGSYVRQLITKQLVKEGFDMEWQA
jgi:hypothetical protein